MNLRKVQIVLDVSDVQQVLAIALDEDREKALEYIKGSLVKQSKKSYSRIECRFSRSVTAPDSPINFNETPMIMKHQYIQLSDFLVDFISERGGVMSVFNSATVIG